jgi:hypothetical protein
MVFVAAVKHPPQHCKSGAADDTRGCELVRVDFGKEKQV